MSSIFISWVVASVSLLTTAAIVPGMSFKSSFGAITAAFVLGIINYTIKPIIHLLSFPITLVTFGLFSWVINGFSLYIVAICTPGFTIDSFLDAFLGSFIMYCISQGCYMAMDYKGQ